MNRIKLIEAIIKQAPKYADGFILRETLLRLGDLELASLAYDMGIDQEKKPVQLGVAQ